MNPSGKNLPTRPLAAGDLGRVIEIDSHYTGRRREGFYRKRLDAALEDPQGFVYLGCETDGELQGFLLARLQEGEYGTAGRLASMDAIGVHPDLVDSGIGRSLLEALKEILAHKNVESIYTQADWRNLPMLKFFAGAGFALAPRYILERDTSCLQREELESEYVAETERAGDPYDYSDTGGDQPGALARDLIPCRSMQESDLAALVRIDSKITGKGHPAYYEQKLAEALDESGVRVSLVAEQDDHVVGFVMARVDFGEFDRIEPTAVIDSIAVDPDYAHHLVGTALLSQLLTNLSALQIEVVRSEAGAEHYDVQQFLQRNGFSVSQRLAFVRAVT